MVKECRRNSVVRITDRPDMTSAVYRGRKATNQTNKVVVQKFKTQMLFTYDVILLHKSCLKICFDKSSTTQFIVFYRQYLFKCLSVGFQSCVS